MGKSGKDPKMAIKAALNGGYEMHNDGIFRRGAPVRHHDDEFNQEHLKIYAEMEPRHFWYAGRRRFLRRAMKSQLGQAQGKGEGLSAIDLGGGCGGWVKHLRDAIPDRFVELALADSSPVALDLAGRLVPPGVKLYQVDLRDLGWRDRWDVAFLLDVLEHIRDDELVLDQIKTALRPGGLLFVTTPALERFRSYNDELEHHVRRYSRSDFKTLAESAGLELRDARYFMFFLSPLLLASRACRWNVVTRARPERMRCFKKAHRIPTWPLNACMRMVFSAEAPLGHWLSFPWGTSILGVFQKPY